MTDLNDEEAFASLVHDALDRMKRAHDRGTGCRLTADMIHALSCSFLGQTWSEDRPASTSQDHSHG